MRIANKISTLMTLLGTQSELVYKRTIQISGDSRKEEREKSKVFRKHNVFSDYLLQEEPI